MKFFSKLVLIIVVVIALIIGALAIFVATFDANDYKQQIISLVKKQTGRDLAIDGDLKLAVYPDIALEVGKASLSNAAGFSGEQFATVSSGKVSVKLVPLLKKQIKADEVFLDGLQLNLQRKVDSSTNWDDLAKSGAKETETTEKKEPAKVVQELMDNLSIAGVNLKDANIHWIDEQAKQDITLSPLNLSTGKFSPGTPLPIELSVVAKQKNPPMTIVADGNTTLTLSKDNKNFSLSKLKLHTNVKTAQLGKGSLDANISGDVNGSPQKISITGMDLQTNLTGDLIPEGSVKTHINGKLDFDVNAQVLTIAGMKVDSDVSGKPLAGGTLKALVSGDTKLDLAKQLLTIPNLALDAKMTGGHVKGGAANTIINGQAQFDLTKQLLTINGMKATANANGDVLQGGKADANIVGNINLDLDKQLLSIPNLALEAKLTGGYVKGGAADANIKGNTQFDLGTQLLSIDGMTATANANGELFKGGKANSNIAGDLQLDLANSQIRSPSISVNSNVEGGLIPGGKLEQTAKGNIDLNWANKNGAVNLADLLVKLAGMEIKGSQVQIDPLAVKPSISGQFQTNTFNLKQVMKTLGITPPVTNNPNALSQLQASFALKADTDKADLQGLNVKLDKSTLSGSLGIANFAGPSAIPGIRPQLTIDSINLDDYLAPASKTVAAGQAQTAAQKELLPIDTLRKLDIDGSFKIGKMEINRVKMANVSAKISAKQGLIVIDPANASLYSGTYKGRISIDAKAATPTMNMRHEVTGLRSEGLLFDLFQDKYISGGTKLITELSSRGNSIDALLKNLNGNTSIAFNDGTIRDSNFAEKVSLAVKVFEKKETQDGKSVVKFTGLSGDWTTTNGVFKTDNLQMLAPLFNISGSGTADVANQTLNMKLRIGPNTKEGENPLFAPLTITGTFSNPKFGLDLQDLIKSLAAQDIEKVKQQAKQQLEEKKQELQQKIAAEKAEQEQKLKQKLEDAKTDAIQKLKAKTGEQLGNTLLEKIGGGSKPTTPAATQDPNAPAPEQKSVEDQVKDKLKNKLKGLF